MNTIQDLKYLPKNKELSLKVGEFAKRLLDGGAELLFAIVGDMSLAGQYADTALIFTDSSVF